MSSQAFADYRVGGPPFLVVVAGGEVQTEGVAWGIAETVRATRQALGESPVTAERVADRSELSQPSGMLWAKKEGRHHARTTPVQPGHDGTTHH